MKSFPIIIILNFSLGLLGCREMNRQMDGPFYVAVGQMPSIASDGQHGIRLVFGNGDSIFYAGMEKDAGGFSSAELIDVLPNLAASHMRGPQIALSGDKILVTVSDNGGNIFSYNKKGSGNWGQKVKVNDRDTVAKEGFMALGADGDLAFLIWLDLRSGHNQLYGTRSTDGGKSWSKNFLVYASPDSTICECCKPSVAIKGQDIYVMFRNWLDGNRDLYLVHSADGGAHFSSPEKLGMGSWKLDGCPMDGGGLVLSRLGPQTIWRRRDTIFSAAVNQPEMMIGKGRNGAIEVIGDKYYYAWVRDGKVVILKPGEQEKILADGQLPLIKAINKHKLVCIWEYEQKIFAEMVLN